MYSDATNLEILKEFLEDLKLVVLSFVDLLVKDKTPQKHFCHGFLPRWLCNRSTFEVNCPILPFKFMMSTSYFALEFRTSPKDK